MALPTIGGSDGTWGTEIASYLGTSLDPTSGKLIDGALLAAAVQSGDPALTVTDKGYVDGKSGLAKAWGSYDGSAGAPSEFGSFAVTSLVRNSVGNYTVTFSVEFSGGYAVVIMGAQKVASAAIAVTPYIGSQTSTATTFIYRDAAAALQDPEIIMFSAFGDLA